MQNKYDTNITLEDNSSLTYMLNNIEPGSTVLEFGPATGYMTRYLEEQMQCRVYIIEIDADAFEKASVYAEDGLCGSAEGMEWYERFRDIRFDYITFADVLEHLVDPWKVLERAARLLKERTGKILVSIPNIAHNAVLVDLINNKFKYRRTGIMDNTHLRFFTHESLVEMFHECGLYVMNEDAVVFNLEYAGFDNSEQDISENVWMELQLRKYGFVNQFLFTLSPNHTGEIFGIDQKTMLTFENVFYYSQEKEYTQECKQLGNITLNGTDFETEFEFSEPLQMRRAMIKLFPFSGVLSNLRVESDVPVTEVIPLQGEKADDMFYFYYGEVKPEIDFGTCQTVNKIRITGNIEPLQISQAERYLRRKEEENLKQLSSYDQEIARLNEVVEDKIQIIGQLGENVHGLQEQMQNQSGQLEEQAAVIRERERQLEEQASVLGEKEKQLEEQALVLGEKENFIHKVEQTRWFKLFGKIIMREK